MIPLKRHPQDDPRNDGSKGFPPKHPSKCNNGTYEKQNNNTLSGVRFGALHRLVWDLKPAFCSRVLRGLLCAGGFQLHGRPGRWAPLTSCLAMGGMREIHMQYRGWTTYRQEAFEGAGSGAAQEGGCAGRPFAIYDFFAQEAKALCGNQRPENKPRDSFAYFGTSGRGSLTSTRYY